MSRPDFCSKCPISHVTEGYVPILDVGGDHLIVGEAAGSDEIVKKRPFVGGAGTWLTNLFRQARTSKDQYSIVNTIGCKPPQNIYPLDKEWKFTSREVAKEGVAYCIKHHLEPALKLRKWRRILALGNWALFHLTGKRGITLWRGSPLQLKHYDRNTPPVIMPTLHPAAIMRDPTMFSVVKDDITRSLTVPKESYNLFATVEDLKNFKATTFAFDLEWDREGQITLCGLSDGYYSGLVTHINSEVLAELKRIFENAQHLIGQNIIGADLPMFKKQSWTITAKLHDTMLKQHLVQPMYKHDLGFIASVYTAGVFWKGRGEETEDEFGESYEKQQYRTWDSPDAIPREYGGYGSCISADEAYRLYNARDTSKAFECNFPLDADLKRYDLEDLYWNSQVPVATICQEITQGGWRIDPLRVGEIRESLERKILELELQLPEGLKPYNIPVNKLIDAPSGTFKPKVKRCKGSKKAGTSHDVQEILFTNLSNQLCPVCNLDIKAPKLVEQKKIKVPDVKRIVPWNSSQQVINYAEAKGIKVEKDKKSGNKSADKGARKVWSKNYPEFLTVNDLKVKQTLCSTFTKESWKDLYRVFYNIKVHGTKEGRFSCVGQRRGLDPNLQQMPKSARKLFIPDLPSWGILQADWKSGENMLTAHLANDTDRLTRLKQPGYNEHIDIASRMFDREVTKADEVYYKAGKKLNHMRNYGAGPAKTQESILEETGTLFPLKEIKGFIDEWKKLNRGTAEWQASTKRLVEQQGYLTNPFGRKLWFTNRDYANKALAFLPASTLADIMIRTMIALYGDRFPGELMNMRVAKTTNIIEPWRFMIPVHDSFVFQGPENSYKQMGERLRTVMSQNWVQLDNFNLDVELEWSGVGGSWGDCSEDKY